MLKIISTQEFLETSDEFEIIIDARSPKEYADSKIPNAINLFALSDEEHKEVGYTYKKISKNEAKIKGASYICLNTAKHIYTLNSLCKVGSKIAIYCARGGLRSTALGDIFSGIGYRVCRLESGYKGFRSFVVDYLESSHEYNFIVLGGNTGCGKSELIQLLENSIDLEALANHLGSTFGSIKGSQPTQKEFQNRLFSKLSHVDKSKPIFIEGESKRIGSIMLPNLLYDKMGEGIRVEITAPIEARVKRILKDYIDIDDEFFNCSMDKISKYIEKKIKFDAIEFYKDKNLAKVAEILLLYYYDKVYKKPKVIDFTIENIDNSTTLQELNTILEIKT